VLVRRVLARGALARARSFQKLRGVLAGGALVRQILQKLGGVLARRVLVKGVLAKGKSFKNRGEY